MCDVCVSASEAGGGWMLQSRPGEDDVHRGLKEPAVCVIPKELISSMLYCQSTPIHF